MVRYGAIDVGSNAVRLLIADISEGNNDLQYKKNTFIRVPLRLGDDSFINKKISSGKATDLVKTMSAFKNLMDVYQVSDYLACATSAMREAENKSEIISRIQKESGINLEIIEGEREANIISANHIEEQLNQNKQYLYIDVGGGSTELSIFNNGNFNASKSFNVGTIRMLDNKVEDKTWSDMKSWIDHQCKDFNDLDAIGTGGNINKLFRLSNAKDNSALPTKKLIDVVDNLNRLSLRERINTLGLNPDRADVIIPAGEIYLTLMKWAKVKNIYVPKVGLADGIIKLLMEKKFKKS